MTASLLATKLRVPPRRPNLVPRPRLIERLNAGLWQSDGFARRLTVVCAPAGFGKTTLVTEWLGGLDHPRTWLSLDEEDNDPVRFLAYLVAALRQVDPQIGRAVQAVPQGPQLPPPEVLLIGLINELAATPTPFVLVVDDYHLIHTLAIHQQLAFLLDHQPAQMHLAIISREEPPLPLSRLRARGQTEEIRQVDLQFTRQEAADFMRTMQLELLLADIAALHERTEGWIAGLQLAALSLRGREDVRSLVESFAGSHHYILDYLIQEVFHQQPAEVQDFLLKTSILGRLTASLCNAVLERKDSGEMLSFLEHANLFTVPLDESRQWYRYHTLFADLLRHRLQAVGLEDLVPALHRRASQWYAAAGQTADAVHHALAGVDWERAAALILAASPTMLKQGEMITLLRWYQALPDGEVRSRPSLCVQYIWVLILTGQLDAAGSYLEPVVEAAQHTPALLGEAAAAQAHLARSRGDDRRTVELSQRALALLPQADANARSVVATNLGVAHWNLGHLREAEQALTEADQAAQQSGNHYARLVALGFLGVIQATWGKLHGAAELYERAIRSGQRLPPVALAHNELGALLYEWNDLDLAADHLRQGLELSQRAGNLEILVGGYRALARLKQAQGDSSGALDVLQQALQLARDHDLPSPARARTAACYVQIALAQGDMVTATRYARQVMPDADTCPFYPLLGLTHARLLIAQNQKASAAEQLAIRLETAEREGWAYGVIAVRSLQCLAAPTLDEALAFLIDALTLAEPEGYVRTFVDLGEPMADLLSAVKSQRPAVSRQPSAVSGQRSFSASSQAYASTLLAAFDRLRALWSPSSQSARVTASDREPEIAQPRSAKPRVELIEPLSDRELDVLRLLVQGCTNQEIAQALYISINTVKTHLKTAYDKLGVHVRRQAAARVRELGLVS